LTWMLDRISALAILQRRLCPKQSAAFRDYLRDIEPQWNKILSGGDISITIDMDEDVVIAGHSAVTLALIANELVTNCVEHAIPHGAGGAINVDLRFANEVLAELSISDDGCGIPPVPLAELCGAEKGLGLVTSLASQIGGRFRIERRRPMGTCATITFPV